MDVNLNVNATRAAQQTAATILEDTPTPASLPNILSGSSLSVTGSDLSSLVAKLFAEANEARENSLLSGLKALSDSGAFEKLRDAANTEAKGIYDKIEQETQDLSKLDAELRAAKNALDAAKDALDAADEAGLEEAQKAYNAAEKKVRDLEDKQKKLDKELANTIGTLDATSLGQLMGVLSATIEDMNHVNPLKENEEDAEEKRVVTASEQSPFAIIRDSLRRSMGDLLDTQETRRENMV